MKMIPRQVDGSQQFHIPQPYTCVMLIACNAIPIIKNIYMSMLIRYISRTLINLATKASKWNMTFVPVLMRCS